MRTLAILPVKSFGAAKQRLSGLLATGSREALAQAMFSDVLGALRRVEMLESVAVVTADPRAQSAATRATASWSSTTTPRPGQSAAARIGTQYALNMGYERILLVPGDAPLLDPAELTALLASADPAPSLTIVPDRHGEGTNALLIAPPDAFDPSFGPGSLERHIAAARAPRHHPPRGAHALARARRGHAGRPGGAHGRARGRRGAPPRAPRVP